jgi:adenylate cyclase
MSQTRQLAAIMFTDIVGYTALMGNDEQNAFAILIKNRALQKPIIEQFNGRWIKELGDGVMASFSTVSDAVNAAIKIQENCNAAKEFQLRIGIHLGDVLFENDDVFGDGVNIASRIQAIVKPGCIYVSESVHNNISNKRDIQTKFIKEETLKNVKEPVRMYEVMITNSTSLPSENKMKINTQNSIAVLPFANMSSDPEQEYFSDGISEEIINMLAQVPGLKVAGRTSSFSLKGKTRT